MRPSWILAVACFLAACGDDEHAQPDAPVVTFDAAPDAPPAPQLVDDYCPGSAHCSATGDDQLYVGAGKALINPDFAAHDTEWVDANMNEELDPGESFTDKNGNGRFDGLWMAGYSSGKPAVASHDDLEVRAIALRYNGTTVVIAYLDTVGYFYTDEEQILADPAVAALDVDHIIVGATHNHQGIDTMGIWGPDATTNGVSPDYIELTHQRAAQAIVAAVQGLRPARMLVATTQTVDPVTGSTLMYVGDKRDPVIYDPTVTIARFVDAASPTTTIGTLVNWASHPGYVDDTNLASADYVHYVREVMENGLTAPWGDAPGIGGVTVFVQGPLGGQIGPEKVDCIGADGMPVMTDGFVAAEACGTRVGALALEAITTGATMVDDAPLSYRTGEIYARIDNTAFRVAFMVGIINGNRPLYMYDPTMPIDDGNVPWLKTRLSYVQIGPVAAITCPAELNPELWVGGYQAPYPWSWGEPILEETVNMPNLAMAPGPPYLRDLMLMNPGVQYPFVAGLAHDELGYVVAGFNYVRTSPRPRVTITKR